MLLSLCGTPGTGKTTSGAILARTGFHVASLGDLIEDLGLAEGYDPVSRSDIVDVDELREALEAWVGRIDGLMVLEGHLSYLAPSDLCLMLRLHPEALMARLRARGYSEAKCRENAEAEFVGTLMSWAIDEEVARLRDRSWEDLPPGCGIVLENDVTDMSAERIAEWVRGSMDAFLGKGLNDLRPYRPGKVDWLEVL